MADRTKALFAAVYADPTADGPRAVLADHLQEQGDPRGEFIALQLAKLQRKPTAAATRKENTLLANHRTTWLGALAGTVNEPHSTWARGFLDTVLADFTTEAAADPSWNTVRTIRIVGGFPPRTQVLGAGCFAALTEIGRIELGQLPALLDAPRKPPLETLAILGSDPPPKQRKLIDRLVELPNLTRLSLADCHGDWLWASPIMKQLAHLELVGTLPFDLASYLPALAGTALETFALAHTYFTFRLARDADRAWTRLTVEWHGVTNAAGPLSHVARTIRELPPDALTAFDFLHPTARWSTRALAVVTNAVARQQRIKRKRA